MSLARSTRKASRTQATTASASSTSGRSSFRQGRPQLPYPSPGGAGLSPREQSLGVPGGRHRPVRLLDPSAGSAPVRGHLAGGLAVAGREHARDASVQDGALGAEQGAADGVLEQGVAQPVPVMLGRCDQVGVEQLPQPDGHVDAGADARCQLGLRQWSGGDGEGGRHLGASDTD